MKSFSISTLKHCHSEAGGGCPHTNIEAADKTYTFQDMMCCLCNETFEEAHRGLSISGEGRKED